MWNIKWSKLQCALWQQTNEILRKEKLGKTILNYIVHIASVLISEYRTLSSLFTHELKLVMFQRMRMYVILLRILGCRKRKRSENLLGTKCRN